MIIAMEIDVFGYGQYCCLADRKCLFCIKMNQYDDLTMIMKILISIP